MMKNETTMKSSTTIAFDAALQLHPELMSDPCFDGYEGTKAAFDSLYLECQYIAFHNPHCDVEEVINLFYTCQLEITRGIMSPDYYLN
jgi:hypothetical protein